MAASARAVLIRSSHSSTGSPRPFGQPIRASSRAAPALSSSSPSPLSGSPTTRPDGACGADQLEEPRHGKTLAPAPHQRLQRRGQGLGLVAEREADPDLAPVNREQAARVWKGHGRENKSVKGKA